MTIPIVALGNGKLGTATKAVTLGAQDDDAMLAAFNGPNNTTITRTKADFDGPVGVTGILDGANGRRPIVTVTHATSIVACDGTITGVDVNGVAQTENWSVTATGTSKTYVCLKTFLRVDTFTVHSTGNATTDSIKFGYQYSRRLSETSVTCVGAVLQGYSTNTNPVAIGDIDVDVTAASAKGLRVDAKGLTPYLPVFDLREVCIDPTTTAEGVSILYLK